MTETHYTSHIQPTRNEISHFLSHTQTTHVNGENRETNSRSFSWHNNSIIYSTDDEAIMKMNKFLKIAILSYKHFESTWTRIKPKWVIFYNLFLTSKTTTLASDWR